MRRQETFYMQGSCSATELWFSPLHQFKVLHCMQLMFLDRRETHPYQGPSHASSIKLNGSQLSISQCRSKSTPACTSICAAHDALLCLLQASFSNSFLWKQSELKPSKKLFATVCLAQDKVPQTNPIHTALWSSKTTQDNLVVLCVLCMRARQGGPLLCELYIRRPLEADVSHPIRSKPPLEEQS